METDVALVWEAP